MDKPLVSIIIPVYNGSNFVREAIDSALAQTYENIEILVINDGSKDDGKTEQIALSYGDKIRYFYKENGGVSSALNLGISNMRGEYFSWLSHDDKYTPLKIETQVATIEKTGRKNIVALCGTAQINKNSEYISKGKNAHGYEKGKIISWQTVLKNLYEKSVFNGCALLIPKIAFEKAGGFNENLRYTQDLFMWTKICCEKIDFVYDDAEGVLSRVHDGQLTQTGRKLYHENCKAMAEVLIPEFASLSTKKDNFLYAFARYNAKYNNKSVVKDCKKVAKEQKLFTLCQRIKLSFLSFYGGIRPLIRKIYYKLFKKVKTE